MPPGWTPTLLAALAMAPVAQPNDAVPRVDTGAADLAATAPMKWAGTQAILGSRRVPLLGTVAFRTDTYVLATVRRSDRGYDLEQQTCRVVFPKSAGARVWLEPTAPSHMPPSLLTFHPGDDDAWLAGPWISGWDEQDHDQDGRPGISLHVKAPLCGGRLDIASRARSHARGQQTDAFLLEGDLTIWVEQTILDARGPCLSLMADDRAEWMTGRFAYVEAPPDATCTTLPTAYWPDPLAAP